MWQGIGISTIINIISNMDMNKITNVCVPLTEQTILDLKNATGEKHLNAALSKAVMEAIEKQKRSSDLND